MAKKHTLFSEKTNEEIVSPDHAVRYLAKEKQAFEMFVNSKLELLDEDATEEEVQAVIQKAIDYWKE